MWKMENVFENFDDFRQKVSFKYLRMGPVFSVTRKEISILPYVWKKWPKMPQYIYTKA